MRVIPQQSILTFPIAYSTLHSQNRKAGAAGVKYSLWKLAWHSQGQTAGKVKTFYGVIYIIVTEFLVYSAEEYERWDTGSDEY